MVNKRGWLRIVEASIAILIIFSVLLIVNSKSGPSEEQDLTHIITPLLEEIARNATLRENVINQGSAAQPELAQFVKSRIIQSNIKLEVIVCPIEQICSMSTYPQDAESVYASERVISSTIDTYNPRKVKIFLWRSAK